MADEITGAVRRHFARLRARAVLAEDRVASRLSPLLVEGTRPIGGAARSRNARLLEAIEPPARVAVVAAGAVRGTCGVSARVAEAAALARDGLARAGAVAIPCVGRGRRRRACCFRARRRTGSMGARHIRDGIVSVPTVARGGCGGGVCGGAARDRPALKAPVTATPRVVFVGTPPR